MKYISLILVLMILSGCIYNKGEILQIQLSEHIGIKPSTTTPKIVFDFNEKYDYTLNFIMDERIFGEWQNIVTGEKINIYQIGEQSVFETESSFYGLIFITPYELAVMTNNEPVRFSVIKLSDNELIMSMIFDGGVYMDTYNRVYKNAT